MEAGLGFNLNWLEYLAFFLHKLKWRPMNSASREKERDTQSVMVQCVHSQVCYMFAIWSGWSLLSSLSQLSPLTERGQSPTITGSIAVPVAYLISADLPGADPYRPPPPYHLNHRDTKERSGRVSLSFLRGTRISYICSPDLCFWTAGCGCVKAPVSTAGCCCYLSFFFLLLLHSEQILHRDEDSGTLFEELKGARVWLSLVYFHFLILNRALCSY